MFKTICTFKTRVNHVDFMINYDLTSKQWIEPAQFGIYAAGIPDFDGS